MKEDGLVAILTCSLSQYPVPLSCRVQRSGAVKTPPPALSAPLCALRPPPRQYIAGLTAKLFALELIFAVVLSFQVVLNRKCHIYSSAIEKCVCSLTVTILISAGALFGNCTELSEAALRAVPTSSDSDRTGRFRVR